MRRKTNARPRFYRVIIGNIHRVKVMRLAKRLLKLINRLLRAATAEHRMAKPRKLLRHRTANPVRDAGDNDGSVEGHGVIFAQPRAVSMGKLKFGQSEPG